MLKVDRILGFGVIQVFDREQVSVLLVVFVQLGLFARRRVAVRIAAVACIRVAARISARMPVLVQIVAVDRIRVSVRIVAVARIRVVVRFPAARGIGRPPPYCLLYFSLLREKAKERKLKSLIITFT
jgi:translation initiation factor IF-1